MTTPKYPRPRRLHCWDGIVRRELTRAISTVRIVIVIVVIISAGLGVLALNVEIGPTQSTSSFSDAARILVAYLSPGLLRVSVQNVGSSPITSLTGNVGNQVTLTHFLIFGGNFGALNSTNPLYPEEIGINVTTFASGPLATSSIGTQFALSINVGFKDGSQSSLTGSVRLSNPKSCGAYDNNAKTMLENNLTLDKSTNTMQWNLTFWNDGESSIVGLVASLNNFSSWASFMLSGAPVGPNNTLGANLTISAVFKAPFRSDSQGKITRSWAFVCSDGAGSAFTMPVNASSLG